MTSRFDRKKVRLRKDEGGYALVLVLILLILIGLIIGPLLVLMTTTLVSSYRHEQSMLGFYAADAGIEAGIWQLQNGSTMVDPFDLNDSTVGVTITGPFEDNTYKIVSTATDNDNGKSTTIESYVSYNEYSLFENVITSRGNIDIQPGATVTGTIQYDPDEGTLEGEFDEDQVVEAELAGWPTAEELSARYWPQVQGHPYDFPEIDIKDLVPLLEIEPLYRDGDLKVYSSENLEVLQATLNGTVYVTGDLTIGQTNHDFILDLGARTIFCEGSMVVADKVEITGNGCMVIAVGDVFFGPKIQSDPEDFVFVMSVTGEVQFNPLGDFYGALAGDVNIQLQPLCTLTHTYPPEEVLNFPDVLARAVSRIATYNIVD